MRWLDVPYLPQSSPITANFGNGVASSVYLLWTIEHRMARRARLGFPVALFLLAFSIYLLTLAPTITWRNDGADGGDLIAAAYTLGIAHPPGYPMYVVLGKLFTLLPIGDVAYRVNLMSAFFAAATIPLVYLITLGLCRSLSRGEGTRARRVAASTAALCFAFSPTFWSQATIAEVYTLNAFFVALLFYLLLKWRGEDGQRTAAGDDRQKGYLLLAAFIYGLSLGNHLSMLALAPAVLFLIVQGKHHLRHRRLQQRPANHPINDHPTTRPNRTHLKGLLAAGLSFLLGLSIYLLLPLRAMQHPPVNWGDPHTWQGFLWTVSGQLYRGFAFSLSPAYIPARASAWANLLVQQFGWWGLLLGLIGLWHCLNEARAFSTFSLLAFGAVIIYAITYDTTDSYVYLIPSYLVFATWLGAGIHYLLTALRQVQQEGSSRFTFYVSRLTLLFLCLPLISLWRNFSSLDLSNDRVAYDYGTQAFEVLEPSAIVIADTDPHTFTLWYFSYVVGERPDVVVLDGTLLAYSWYRDNVRLLHPQVSIPNSGAGAVTHLIESNRAHHPIYLTDYEPGSLAGYSFSSQGPLYQLEE
jgi:hypothetical protein